MKGSQAYVRSAAEKSEEWVAFKRGAHILHTLRSTSMPILSAAGADSSYS